MKNTIKETTRLLLQGTLTKDEADKILLDLLVVSVSLLSDEEIRDAADKWVFDKNGTKWSNNDDTAGDNYGSFIAGVKWALTRLGNER